VDGLTDRHSLDFDRPRKIWPPKPERSVDDNDEGSKSLDGARIGTPIKNRRTAVQVQL